MGEFNRLQIPPEKPTFYNGVLYRSKLEALWKAAFEDLEVRTLYEAQTFQLPTFGTYTPDFWTPEPDLYVEIKPRLKGADLILYEEFYTSQKKGLLLISGRPSIYAVASWPWISNGETTWIHKLKFAKSPDPTSPLWLTDGDVAISLCSRDIRKEAPADLEKNTKQIIAALRDGPKRVR